MLGNDWQPDMDPTGWWLSEKYDGVRAYLLIIFNHFYYKHMLIKERLWSGEAFYSRSGRILSTIPDFFKKGLPETQLDGELWYFYFLPLFILSILSSFIYF